MESYLRWLRILRDDDRPLFELGHVLPYLSIPERKVLLVQSRCQVCPTKKSRLYQVAPVKVWATRFILPKLVEGIVMSKNLYDLASSLSDYMNPFYSGLISMLIRHAPYDDHTSVVEEQESALRKEIQAAVGKYHPTSLDYTPFLEREGANTRVEQNLPLDYYLNTHIRQIFHLSKQALSSPRVILFPDMSTKTVGVEAKRGSRQVRMVKGILEKENVETTEDLEIVYARTGFQFSGLTELRSAWKYNDLKPRIYYARGPSVYYASRYIQAIFNIILDLFPNVNRYSRHNAQSVHLEPRDIAFIYDYSSFTSNLHEIRNFIAKLAEFYSGTYVTILDTFAGVKSVDLGVLLSDYNQACNIEADFDPSDLLEVSDLVLRHNCGMLGVPGNISSCTLLHGLHLACIVGGIEKSRCVGDDAYAIKSREDNESLGQVKSTIAAQLQNIGVVSLPKTEWWDSRLNEDWDEDTWHYVKRPITRVEENKMEFGFSIEWPSLANILGFSDSFHVIRTETLIDRQKIYGAQVMRFLSVIEAKIAVTDSVTSFIRRFLHAGHRSLGIPSGGLFPTPGISFWVPSERYFGDFVGDIGDRMSGSIIRVPRVFQPGVDDFTVDLRYLEQFSGPSNRILSLLVRLGYLSRTLVTEDIIADEHPEKWSMLLKGQAKTIFSFVYVYSVVENVPAWAYDLLDRSHVPHERSQLTQYFDEDTIDDIEMYLAL